ncbi:protease pro-enzyme activation domain-containing protein [Leifsonia xyli]|uniref:protease pro-enzyme activation domain-containing protein n=1 Tax=Leifsonia xyli TaxID=1575 RepID=UPI0004221DDA|nr:protease pro-enzyme activation domain-containing protein [Leifsonia xyli]
MLSHVLVRAAAGAAAALTIGGLALAAGPDPSRPPLTGSVPGWTATTASLPAPDADTTLAVVLRAGSSAAEARAVAEWLDGHGLDASRWDDRTGVLRVKGARSRVAAAFDTAFAVYSRSSGSTVAPTTALSVPASLPQIVGVSGVVTGDGYRPTASAAGTPVDSPDCAAYWGEKLSSLWPASLTVEHRSNSLCGYSPKQLRAVQQVPDGYRGAGTKVAIVAAFNDPSVAANTDKYSQLMGEPALTDGQYVHHAPDHPAVSRCGGPNSWTEEQHLDVQAVHAIAPEAKIEYWGRRTAEPPRCSCAFSKRSTQGPM